MNVNASTVLGVLLGIVGLAALVVPGLATGVPANDALVAVLGLLLVLGALREGQRRRNADAGDAETADVERAVELPTPGGDFDRRLDRLTTILYRTNERQRLREEVADVAVETLQRRLGLTEGEARAALREGTWTDDPFAAAFLSGQAPDVGRATLIREFVRSGTAFQHRARRAVDELYRLAAGGEGADD